MTDIIELIRNQPDLYVMNGVTEEEVCNAEQALCLHFNEDYRRYLIAFGSASFDCHELTGICKSNRLNVVAVTNEERNYAEVPSDWYVLEQANIDGIVLWQDHSGAVYQTMPNTKPQKLCESLTEYIKLDN